jgi:hypothetical protein
VKRDKGDRHQRKVTRVRRKSDGEIMESSVTFYENAEDLLKDSDNEFYVDEDGNHENELEIVASHPPPLTEEAHHSIVSSSFV